ncbi:MAG: four helix bundle protein [Pyrinomonadaceae bacterium]|nr:four helix bundle protein [Pyrinomonadaceae bacterium]MBP6214525.1 four helix bundle protein [Pyrinomonadaceae bacterium]
MKYSTFEELPVWQAAISFALDVFEFTEKADFRGLGDTKNQLERAALSISNNIAEGFERGTTTEIINFLYIARGSAGESRSMLRICERVDRFSNFRSEISNLTGKAVNISKQLHGWLESLKNSEIKGVKFLTEQERKRFADRKELVEFDNEMVDFRARHQQWLVEKQTDPNAKLKLD